MKRCSNAPHTTLSAIAVNAGTAGVSVSRFLWGLVILLVIFFDRAAHADVVFVPDTRASKGAPADFSEVAHLMIFQEITERDVYKVRELIPRARETSWVGVRGHPGQKMPLVFFNSSGGDVVAAMKIGEALREAMATTVVIAGHECLSACVFAYLGGIDRWRFGTDKKFGLHRPYFEQSYFADLSYAESQSRYRALVELSEKYLERMGARPGLMQQMLAVPSQSIDLLDYQQAEYWGITGKDPAFAEWERAGELKTNGKDWVEYTDCLIDALNRTDEAAYTRCGDVYEKRH